jgi:hypothetical protein
MYRVNSAQVDEKIRPLKSRAELVQSGKSQVVPPFQKGSGVAQIGNTGMFQTQRLFPYVPDDTFKVRSARQRVLESSCGDAYMIRLSKRAV